MCGAQSRDHLGLALHRKDRLEADLADPLLDATAPDRGIRSFPADERARPVCVEATALVAADPAGPSLEQRLPYDAESLAWNEDDELAIQISTSGAAGASASPVFGSPLGSIRRT